MKTISALKVLILIITAHLLCTHTTYAQAGGTGHSSVSNIGSVSGKLADSKNKPIAYATVTLMRMDSSIINGDLSKDDGTFSISPTGIGNFRLRVESIGITTKFFTINVTTDTPDRNLGIMKLTTDATMLKEAQVVGEKAAMELKVDKKVFNVEKNITSAGGNATDVLQNVPSVSVDVDGNVSLRGKSSVTILIDGKPATLLGSDVTSVLQSLPASSVENVEVIANPSAKYDASGTTGIINIVTKKDNRLGVNGNITLGAGTRDKYNGNFGLNIRKGKWTAFMNSNVRINNTYNDVITDRTGKDTSYHTFEHVPRHFNGFFNNLGVTYDANKYNSITVTGNINAMDFGYKDYSNYSVFNNPSQTPPDIFHQTRYSFSDGKPFNYTTAIDYKHKFKKKDEEITVDGTYSDFAVKRTSDVNTKNDSSADIIVESAPGHGSNQSFTGFADYTDPMLTKNGKFGAGVKTQLTWFNSHNDPIKTIAGVTTMDTPLLTRYNYTQQIHAAYVNWSDQLDKFSYQVGLRAEDAEYNGTNQGIRDTSLKNSFFNLFPSAFVSYQLPSQQSIYLNYSRRTNRPNFFQLLPYKDLSNPGTISTGNPGLIPEFIDNIEFSYNKLDKKGNNIILSAYYQYTQNLIDRILIVSPDPNDNGKLLSTPENLASGQTYGFEAIGNLKLTKIWEATLSANLFQNDLTLGNQYRAIDASYSNRNGFGGFGKVNTTIKLPKNFSFQVNGNYESKKVVAQGTIRETYWVDVALRKTMLKGKVNVVVNCSDIFKSHKFINDYNFGSFDQVTNRIKETRIGNINITYRFGKTDFGKDIAGGKRKPDDLKPTKETKAKPSDEDRGKNLKDNDDDNQGGGGQGGGGGQRGK